MSTKPDMLKWVANDDPTKIVVMPDEKKANGFFYLEKPAFQYVNYMFNRIYKWLRGLQGSYAQVIVGSASQVSTNDATHTINQLNDSVVTSGVRVVLLEGTHTLTADLTLAANNIEFTSESGGAAINLASTYRLTLSGNRVRGILVGANPLSGSDAIVISGAGSDMTIVDVPSGRISVAAGSIVRAASITSESDATLIINGIELPRAHVLFTSVSAAILNKYNGAIVVVDATGGTRTMSLPPADDVKAGFTIGIMKGAGTNSVIVAADGTDLIRSTASGVATATLPAISDLVILESDGVSAWIPVGGTSAPKVGTLTDGATIAWDVANVEAGTVTIGGNRTLANAANQRAGKIYTLHVIQDPTGGRTLTFGTDYLGFLPYVRKGAGAVTTFVFLSDGAIMRCINEQQWYTGDVKPTFRSGADVAGWVLMNDGTIGDPTSGATTRAHADTFDLFQLLWTSTNNGNITIQDSSGTPTVRGSDATTDFNNHRRLPLPKALGRALCVAGTGAGLSARQLAGAQGEENHVLTIGEMPSHDHTIPQQSNNDGTNNSARTGSASGTTTTGATGGGAGHNNIQPSWYMNVMMKL